MIKYVSLLIFSFSACSGMATIIAMGEAVEHTDLGKAALKLCNVELKDEAKIVVLDVMKDKLNELAQKELDVLKNVHENGVESVKPTLSSEIEHECKRLVFDALAGAVSLKINELKSDQVAAAKKALQLNASLIVNGLLAAGLVAGTVVASHF